MSSFISGVGVADAVGVGAGVENGDLALVAQVRERHFGAVVGLDRGLVPLVVVPNLAPRADRAPVGLVVGRRRQLRRPLVVVLFLDAVLDVALMRRVAERDEPLAEIVLQIGLCPAQVELR